MYAVCAWGAYGCYAADVAPTINGVQEEPFLVYDENELRVMMSEVYSLCSLLHEDITTDDLTTEEVMILALIDHLAYRSDGAKENYLFAYIETYKNARDRCGTPSKVSEHFRLKEPQEFFSNTFDLLGKYMDALQPKFGAAQAKSHA